LVGLLDSETEGCTIPMHPLGIASQRIDEYCREASRHTESGWSDRETIWMIHLILVLSVLSKRGCLAGDMDMEVACHDGTVDRDGQISVNDLLERTGDQKNDHYGQCLNETDRQIGYYG